MTMRGNLIDIVELDINKIFPFLANCSNYNTVENYQIERKADREYFDNEIAEIARRIVGRIVNDKAYDYHMHNYLNKNTIKMVEDLIDTYGIDAIKFALDFMSGYDEPVYNFNMKDYNLKKKETFLERLEWIKNSSGMWYAMDSSGKIGMAYLEEPTKKQAKYQRTKNDMFIVFLSFRDFKEYKVDESELKI